MIKQVIKYRELIKNSLRFYPLHKPTWEPPSFLAYGRRQEAPVSEAEFLSHSHSSCQCTSTCADPPGRWEEALRMHACAAVFIIGEDHSL